jgi:hypothetical protein
LQIDKEGGFRPEKAFFDDLGAFSGSKNKIDYTPAVDTGFRCLRILFFPSKDNSPGHIQFAAPVMSSDVIARLMAIVTEHGGNIIRIQLRRGFPRDSRGRLGRLKKQKAQESTARLDLTVEPAGDTLLTRKVLSDIEQAIRKDAKLKAFDVDITKHAAGKTSSRSGRAAPGRSRREK